MPTDAASDQSDRCFVHEMEIADKTDIPRLVY